METTKTHMMALYSAYSAPQGTSELQAAQVPYQGITQNLWLPHRFYVGLLSYRTCP